MDFQTFVLPNGIKLIHIQTISPVAHCGFFINTGTRDENDNEHGIAHFIEHLFFKGTKHRKAFHVLSRLEDVGGELNAYTTKEDTCVHASFLKEHYPRTLELFSDIIFNSSFPEKAIASERDVIIDEINSYKDSPSESIFDEFDEYFYAGHPLSQNILGKLKYLKKIGRPDILNFISRTYNTDEMVLASVGNISFSRVTALFERYFRDIPANMRSFSRTPFTTYQPFSTVKHKNTFQIHSILGGLGYDMVDHRRMGLHLLSNILGGPGMISRLNLALRERNGYSYNIESSYTPFSDTGLFNIYFSTDKNMYEKCIDIINKEIIMLRNKPLGAIQLLKAKKQLVGQIAISYESNENQMLSIGKSFLAYERVDTMDEIYAKIEAVTASALLEMSNEILDITRFSSLTYK